MKIKFLKPVAEAIGFSKLAFLGINADSWGWKGDAKVDLTGLDSKKLIALEKLVADNKAVKGIGSISRDLIVWREIQKNADTVKARSVKQFHALLTRYLSKSPGHRIYERTDGVDLPYYVDSVKFHEEEKTRGGDYRAPYVTVKLISEDFGGLSRGYIQFEAIDCRGRTAQEALDRKSYKIETKGLRDAYLDQVARYSGIVKQIGKQFFAVGHGTTDIDGNPETKRRSHEAVDLLREGQPTRVVVDVFHEEHERERESDKVSPDPKFWALFNKGKDIEDESDDDIVDVPDADNIEIPVHPYCAIFDLSKHLRMRCHVDFLTEYVYDRTMSDKLVLDEQLKALVEMLIEHKEGGFQDIIKGKSGGAVVLLAGEPGVGKTLTAEVYAESKERALYSVQCSQLGIDPEELELELLKVFRRARRWNAILILDEADVYVRQRGHDLKQNAIVGVFLRVLEYQGSILFLTTNRPEDVDDAIASRCVARLFYDYPTVEEQKKIWRVLASATKATISDKTIADIGKKNPKLSGRDVKNLLKLSMMVKKGKEIDAATVEFVKQFKPTGALARKETSS